MSWDHPMTVAIAGVVGAALLGLLGYLLKYWWEGDKSALMVTATDYEQRMPTLGEPRTHAGSRVYSETVAFRLRASHNQKGERPIRVYRVGIESERVPIDSEAMNALEYQIDVLNMPGHGVVDVREYEIALRRASTKARYVKSRNESVEVRPENILDSRIRSESVTIAPEGDDAHYEWKFVLNALEPGLYRVRLNLAQDVGGEEKGIDSPWVYVYRAKRPLTLEEYENEIIAGFRGEAELERISKLVEAGKRQEAEAAATAVIERDEASFASPRRARFLRALAYFRRGEIRADLQRFDDSLSDMRASADLGYQQAPYQVVTRLMLYEKEGKIDIAPPPLQEEVMRYLQTGAELGDRRCMDLLEVPLRQLGERLKAQFWHALRSIGGPPEQAEEFKAKLMQVMTREDFAELNRSMEPYMVSGGSFPSEHDEIPGRDFFAALSVDFSMRRHLAFVWRAFFEPEGPNRDVGMATVFEGFRQSIRERFPALDVYLLINRDVYSGTGVPLDPETLMEQIKPGDEIFVRCAARAHYAIVWRLDEEKGFAYLLDPFFEFWLQARDQCLGDYAHEDYRHHRKLVRVRLSDLRPMLTAVFAIRSRRG